MSTFVQLHNHSQYSIIDGHTTIERYLDACERDGQPAFALTDHGNLGGLVSIYTEAKKHGLKPLLGNELYVDWPGNGEERNRYPDHLTVIAMTERGYRDLIIANNIAQKNFYYRPRIDIAEIVDRGLNKEWVVLSGCLSSTISKMVVDNRMTEAMELARLFHQTSGLFAIELMPHEVSAQLRIALIDFARTIGVQSVLTNDCHYLTQASEQMHQELLRRSPKSKGVEFDGDGFHWKPATEMIELCERFGVKDAASYTVEIANQCNVTIPEIDTVTWKVPLIDADPEKVIRERCATPLRTIMHQLDERGRAYYDRFQHEMRTLQQVPHIMQSYLVAWDALKFCHENGIPASARGSMGGSLVSYLMGITPEDPVRHGCIFERAVNPARPTIPDFDLDVSSKHRGRVQEYIAQRYPQSAPLGTYISYGPRSAAKLVLRSYHLSQETMNATTKLIPETWDEIEPETMNAMPAEFLPQIEDYYGLFSTVSKHAAGIILDADPEEVPLMWIASSKQMVTAYDMYAAKKLGLFKLDILGLTAQDHLHRLIDHCGPHPTEYDDPEVFRTISSGRTVGIFQYDGYAARACVQSIDGIRNFEDMIAVNALARPGAAQFIPQYRSSDNALIVMYPELEPVLAHTNGLIIYQEQAMQLTGVLAGFDDAEQDDIKEAMKAKASLKFDVLEEKFLTRCQERTGKDGLPAWKMLKEFAGYGFNRAHAVAYSALAYKLAWYKVHHPTWYYAAIFDDLQTVDQFRAIIESYRASVKWELPEINRSNAETTVIKGKIFIGLQNIYGLGEKTATNIIENRPFSNLKDLQARINKRQVNSSIQHKLALSGALRNIGDPGTPYASGIYEWSAQVFNPVVLEMLAKPPTMGDLVSGFVLSIHPYRRTRSDGKRAPEAAIMNVISPKGEATVSLSHDQWLSIQRAGWKLFDAVRLTGEWNGNYFKPERAMKLSLPD